MARICWDSSGASLALISATSVRVLDYRDGSCKFSHSITEAAKTEGSDLESSPLGPGLLGSFSTSGQYFAVCEPQKKLSVWRTDTWERISQRMAARRVTALLFTNKEDCVVVADKAGDVYRFSVAESQKEAELLLGHISMILDMTITRDDKCLITCDRDEKIRISRFPNAYNIQSYCLGHLDFVSSLCLLPTHPELLISGGGDGCIRSWNLRHSQEIMCQKIEDKSNDQQSNNSEPTEVPVVACLTCCLKNRIVCALIERSRTLYLFQFSEKELTPLPPVQADVPPWHASFDPDGRLWCIQPHVQLPVIVFETKTSLEFSRVPHGSIPALVSAIDWSFLSECVGKDAKLGTLRKKDIDNMTEYLTRKEERIQAKKSQGPLNQGGGGKRAKLDNSNGK